MGSVKAAHLTVIKRFEFSEPIFQPEKLAKSIFSWLPFKSRENYSFLGDAKQIKYVIDHMKTIEIKGVGIVKPIRNPYAPEELYWLPFKASEPAVKLGIRPELPMFPFQVIPSEIKMTIEKRWLEEVLGFAVTDRKAFWELRIYPPGVSTAHLHLLVEARGGNLDLNGLIRLRSQLRTMPITVTSMGKSVYYRGVFKVFNFLANQVAACTLSEGHRRREFPGYYVVYNLQEGSLELAEHEDKLAKLLAGRQGLSSDLYSKMLEGKHEDDILAIGQNTSIISIDTGLLKKYKDPQSRNVLEGRRCFRHHFVSTIELAYVTEALVNIYNRHFKDILKEIEKIPLGLTWGSIIKKYTTRGVLDPCAYGTLQNVILDVPTRLSESRRDGFWTNVHRSVASELGLSEKLEDLKATTNKVYQAAKIYGGEHAARIKSLFMSMNVALDKAIQLAKVAKIGLP